jgi:hypothetical protein
MLPASAIGSTRYRNRWVCGHRDHQCRGPIHAAVYGSSTRPDRGQRPQVRNYRGVSSSPRGNREAPTVRMDLVNNGAIAFGPAELAVTNATTGESFSFRGWGLGVAQLAASGAGPGAQDGVAKLIVRSEDPPTIGNWQSDSARPTCRHFASRRTSCGPRQVMTAASRPRIDDYSAEQVMRQPYA